MTLRHTRMRLISRGDVPGSNGGIYNPGAVMSGSSIFMLCRREIDQRLGPTVFSEVFTLDPDTFRVTGHRTLRKGPYPVASRLEDHRCIEFDGMLLAAHSLVETERIRPMISRIAGDRLEPFDAFDLPVEPARVEKNWVLFERDAMLHCVYKLDPLTVFARTPGGSWFLVKREENGWGEEFTQMLSNSANLIPFMDGFLGFWHTRLNGSYVQGAYLLGSELELKYRTGILLDGAEIRDGYKPGVLYVSSLVEHRDRVLAFYGEGDAHTGVAVFDARQLERELAANAFERRPVVRMRLDASTMGEVFRAMPALQGFCAGSDRLVRLRVTDPRLVPAIKAYGIRNVVVVSERGETGCDYTLCGRTGALVSAASAPASGARPYAADLSGRSVDAR